MGIFSGHTHNWTNYGAAAGGVQQQHCAGGKGCGRVRSKRVSAGLFHTHSYPVARRGSTVECACGHRKRVG